VIASCSPIDEVSILFSSSLSKKPCVKHKCNTLDLASWFSATPMVNDACINKVYPSYLIHVNILFYGELKKPEKINPATWRG